MKRTDIFVIALIILSQAVPAAARVKLAPYYSIEIGQGVALPSKGEWMYPLNLVNDIGLMVQPYDKHKFMGLYELRYNGPGFRKQEGEKFTDRTMSHLLVLRHQYAISPVWTVKAQIDHLNEYKRTGVNEVWSEGLYDYNRIGGSAALGRVFNPRLSVEARAQYHLLEFPNYTDLLSESRLSPEASDTVTGKQNHALYQGDAAVRYGKWKAEAGISLMSYQKQKVVVASVQPDRSYYSSDLQKDMVLSMNIQYEQKWKNGIRLSPCFSVKGKTSNQNYQFFPDSSSVPVEFFGGYFDYREYGLALPAMLPLTKKWDLSVTPEWNVRRYSSRTARDENNRYTSDAQVNQLFILSTGFTYSSSEVTRTTLFYTYQQQSSNMKFEKYLNYNYSGHYFGVNLSYTY